MGHLAYLASPGSPTGGRGFDPPQQLKIQLVLPFGVGLVAYNVHARAPFRDKMVMVAADEVRNPAITNVLF
jgi:hypothetical protein